MKLATKGSFDLTAPRYFDYQWRMALKLALEAEDKAEAIEQLKIVTNQQHLAALLLLAKVLAPLFGNKEDVSKLLVASQQTENSLIGLITGKSEEELKQQGANSKQQQIDASVNAWEKVFGKRGDPKTESAIKNTENILQSMIAEQERIKKAKAKQGKGRK